MRVAIEAASLALSSGGLARYTAELSLALAREFPEDEFFLVSDQEFAMPAPREGAAPGNLKRGGGPRNGLERRWWMWGLDRELERLAADVVHGPDFAVPYIPRRPSVVTLHDLSPWLEPAWHSTAGRVRRRTPALLQMGLATMIVTPGESVRRQAIERFRLRPERVVAVPEAAASWLRPVPRPMAGARDTPYFLFVVLWNRAKTCPGWWKHGGKYAGGTRWIWCWRAGRAPMPHCLRRSPGWNSPGKFRMPCFRSSIPAHWPLLILHTMKGSVCR